MRRSAGWRRIHAKHFNTGEGKRLLNKIMKHAIMAIVLLASVAPQGARQGSVSGRVLRSDGSPVASLRVAAMQLPEGGANAASAAALMSSGQTDSMGRYRLQDVPPGRYRIVAGPLDALAYYPGTWTEAEAMVVTVTSGAMLTSIDLHVAFGSIAGRVSTPKGRPVVGVNLFAIRVLAPAATQNQRGQQGRTGQNLRAAPRTAVAATDNGGAFILNNVPPGQYYIGAGMNGSLAFWSANSVVVEGASPHTTVTVAPESQSIADFILSNDTAENWDVSAILAGRPPILR
ncbi:MAG TPA: carboxypeptidase-like regulatory domain-containing protein [Terriglobia bacterium]|nr:carboxypeptidase-like regulatory domain-containing protein [Terriglobia bacterium]